MDAEAVKRMGTCLVTLGDLLKEGYHLVRQERHQHALQCRCARCERMDDWMYEVMQNVDDLGDPTVEGAHG